MCKNRLWLSLSNYIAVTGSEFGILKHVKFRNLQKLSVRSRKQNNGNVQSRIIAKLNTNSRAFFVSEESEL